MMAPRRYLALCILVLACAFISTRYNYSAAFERPVHFSILSLLLVGITISAWSRSILCQDDPAAASVVPNRNGHFACQLLNRRIVWRPRVLKWIYSDCFGDSSTTILVAIIVIRTILFWRIVRTIQCSWDGLETLFPFALCVANIVESHPLFLPRNRLDVVPRKGIGSSVPWTFTIWTLVWSMAATECFFLAEPGTGAICPPGLWEQMIPLAQLTMLGCDVFVIKSIGKVRQNHEYDSQTWQILGNVFLASAGVLSILAVWSSLHIDNLRWNFFLTSVPLVDLALDSMAVLFAAIAGIHLLGYSRPVDIGLVVVAVHVLVKTHLGILRGSVMGVMPRLWGPLVFFTTSCSGGLLLHLYYDSAIQSSNAAFYKIRVCLYASLALLFVWQAFYLIPYEPPSESISRLVANGKFNSDNWIAGAKQSHSLEEAVFEYSKRYGIPPPPNFDAWYNYAVSVNSPIIDDFGQIHHDLLPFWGTPPSVIRQRTIHLLEHPRLSFGGIVIDNGTVLISPHIRGTHRWMMEAVKEMIEPFTQWLPDMHLAFNLDDECRVSIPHDDMDAYLNEATVTRDQLAARPTFREFSRPQEPPWPKDYLKEENNMWKKSSILFRNWSKSPIFYEWISPTCPPNSPVHNFHWWNKKAACLSCSQPHMQYYHGAVTNWTLAGDLCHQPDLAYLHGFLSSPSAFAATHTLFPVFSQSRISNFADILYPGPWNFAQKVKYDGRTNIKWEDKLNSVYWRGGPSDGYADHGAWQGFLRARFVHMAQTLRSKFQPRAIFNYTSMLHLVSPPTNLDIHGVIVNVSFVGEFEGRCDDGDCVAEHTTFYGSPAAEPAPSIDFSEHWHHKHLIDLDGAGYSGRFLPFLKSDSLPYRAALFRTWWEERVHAWRHFVPLDVRLKDLWTVVRWFGSEKGDAEAKQMARDGAEWAKKALRKEDMQVYMFRLLLEWGRIVDDQRDSVGFSAP